MTYNVYKVEKIDNYINNASTIDYDYAKDFEYLKELRGYIKIDYVITDSELELGKVCFNGDLIKPIAKITSFEAEPIRVICKYKKQYYKDNFPKTYKEVWI